MLRKRILRLHAFITHTVPFIIRLSVLKLSYILHPVVIWLEHEIALPRFFACFPPFYS